MKFYFLIIILLSISLLPACNKKVCNEIHAENFNEISNSGVCIYPTKLPVEVFMNNDTLFEISNQKVNLEFVLTSSSKIQEVKIEISNTFKIYENLFKPNNQYFDFQDSIKIPKVNSTGYQTIFISWTNANNENFKSQKVIKINDGNNPKIEIKNFDISPNKNTNGAPDCDILCNVSDNYYLAYANFYLYRFLNGKADTILIKENDFGNYPIHYQFSQNSPLNKLIEKGETIFFEVAVRDIAGNDSFIKYEYEID